MKVAGAEDDGFLLRPAMFAQAFEQVCAHCSDALRQNQVMVVAVGGVLVFDFFFGNVLASADINRLGIDHLGTGVGSKVYGRLEADDFTSRQIAVFLCLNQRVFINRLAKIFEVVSGDFGIGDGLLLGFAQLAWRGGQANLDGFRVAPQHFRPSPPSRAVAFVDDNHRESVFRVILGQETGVVLGSVIQPQGLIGGNMHLGIFGEIPTPFSLHDADTAFRESIGQLIQSL